MLWRAIMTLSANTGWSLAEIVDLEIRDLIAALDALKDIQPSPPHKRR